MKRTRFVALVCILILAVSLVSTASAITVPYPGVVSRGSVDFGSITRIVKNQETVILDHYGWSYYGKTADDYEEYQDLEFDFEGALTGKSNVSWIHINQNPRSFSIYLDTNDTGKIRTGKVTATGKNFKATVKIRQMAPSLITSVVRKKDMVTVKFNPFTACKQGLIVDMEKTLKDGTRKSKSVLSLWEFEGKKQTFQVKKGWTYSIFYGNSVQYKNGTTIFGNDSQDFTVTKVTGSETIR